MSEWYMVVLGSITSIAGLIFGYSLFKRNEKADISSSAAKTSTLVSDVGYIKSGIDDLKTKYEHSEKRQVEILLRLTRVETALNHLEQDTRQAHIRIDNIQRTQIENCQKNSGDV